MDLDHAVATALKYAGNKALILAVGKSDIGGLALNGYPLRQVHGVGLLGTNAFGYPSITWASGPNGPQSSSAAPAASESASAAPSVAKEPAAFYAPTAIHDAGDVIGVGIGPGSEELKGFIDNTFIFQIIKNKL